MKTIIKNLSTLGLATMMVTNDCYKTKTKMSDAEYLDLQENRADYPAEMQQARTNLDNVAI